MVHPFRDQARDSTSARINRFAKQDQESDTAPSTTLKPRLKRATGGPAMDSAAAPKKRLDRASKGKGTTVNVIIADKPDAPPPAEPMAMKPPMPMPMAAKPPMPPMPPPPGPPGAPPTGLPPQLAAAALAARANGQPPMQRGGPIKMTAGADSGLGRLQEAKAARAGR